MSRITIEDIHRAVKMLSDRASNPPVYVAPEWVYDDPALLNEFTKIAQRFHPCEKIEVIRNNRIV